MKTWEVIKELTENPNKKFRRKEANSYVTVEDGKIVWRGEFQNGQEMAIGFIDERDCEWEEVKEPVTWKEAFEAGLNGKKIKPEGQGLTFSEYHDLDYVMLYLGKRPSYYKKLMLDK